MTVQDLYRILVDSQYIEIREGCGKWCGRAKDIPSCYFDSNIINICNTGFSFIVVYIE